VRLFMRLQAKTYL